MKLLSVLLMLPALLLTHTSINHGYHQLTWKDFTGKRPAGDTSVSKIHTELTFSYRVVIDNDSFRVENFSARATVIQDSSFTTTKDPYVLKHEQGHLDICEYAARAANYEAAKHKKYSNAEFEDIMDSFNQFWKDIDKRYDDMTNHSQDKGQQANWDRWLAAQLTDK